MSDRKHHNRPSHSRILRCTSIFALALSALTGADVPEHRPPRPSPGPPTPSIPITGFLGDEVSLLQSMLQILPAAPSMGITAVQSAVYQNDGVFDTLNVLSPGGFLLYLPPPANRPTDGFYPLLACHFAEALGENVYNAVLTSAERNEWQSLTLPGFNPQQQFGQFYSLWTLYSNSLLQQALTNPPSSANPSLAQTIFVASLFFQAQSNSQNPLIGIQGYGPRNFQNNLIVPSGVLFFVRTRLFDRMNFLSIGAYTFQTENNALVSWSSGMGTSVPLNPPVALPVTWQTRFAAASQVQVAP